MKNGQIISPVQTAGVTFTGSASTGDLSFRIDNVQTQNTGVYKMVTFADTGTPLLCNTVYITGSLSVPNLTSNTSPSVGESVTLTASSSSTTVPAGLPLVYTWQVDGATNPADSRYTYSTSRATLTVSGVQRSDADNVFTCTAEEEGSRITSSSREFRIDVLYGPENVRLEPSPSSYTRTENTTLVPITCRADCNPSCTITWTHLNSTWSTSTAVLDLGQVSRDEAGVYRCTVTRSAGYTSSIDVTVIVQFSSCPSNTNVFTTTGSSVTLQYGANSLPDKISTYMLEDPRGSIRVLFISVTNTIQTLNLTFTGDTSTGDLSIRLDNVQTLDAGVYTMVRVPDTDTQLLCNTVYITGSLAVPSLTSNKFPAVGKSVTLTCSSSSTTVPAGLPLVYTWQVDGATNPVESRYMYSTSRDTLTVSDVQKSDEDKVFTCWAQEVGSKITSISSSELKIDVLYTPAIIISKTPSDVKECTDRLALTCNVSSKPVSTITWYKGQLSLSTTGGNNVGQYTITNVNRTMAGQYRCVAYNGNGGNVQKTVNVSVKYSPDVSAMTRNVTTQDQSVDIVCNPSGVPDQYTFSPWTHQWDINGPVLNHTGLGNNPVLTLTNLTYEHSGMYTCTVSNGVDCSKNPDAGTGHVYLVVKAAPVLLYPQTKVNSERILLATKVTRFAVFTFTFWSNADNTAVTCYKNTNGTRQNTPVGNTVFTQTTVMLPVFSSSIATTGTMATLSLNIGDVEDLGAYDVVLSNQIGEGKLLVIDVVLQGPPHIPVLESVLVLSSTEVSVNWTRGFHGGLDQTIVIQISSDMVHWENTTEVFDGMQDNTEPSRTNLHRLMPSSLYYIRLFAFSDEGRRVHYTNVLSFKTYSEISTQGGSNLDAGVIAGSIVGAIVTLILVGVGIFLYRRVECIWKTKARQQVDDILIMKERPNDHETTIQDTSPSHVYADVDQPVSSSISGQATGPNEYEQAVPASNPEHVYTELQQTTREARNT